MVRDVASKILNLIQQNKGLEIKEIFTNPNVDVQKIVDIILSECRCSITDENGNYTRFGSSTDIRIIKQLIKILISDSNEIPAEIVSMALTKEEVIGPFKAIKLNKTYNEKEKSYDLELEKIFPTDFYINIFDKNIELKEDFIEEILKPYVKEIIYETPVLTNKCRIAAFISKLLTKEKTNEEQVQKLKQMLEKVLNCEENLIENIAEYIYINIMNNKYFKTELINNAIDITELQKLGKVYSGFNSLVEDMASETIRMIQLRNFPYGEYMAIKNTYFTIIPVLQALSTNLEGLDENEILEKIIEINKAFTTISLRKSENIYRTKEINTDKTGEKLEFVDKKSINQAMINLCKMIKVLLESKDNMGIETYVKEVIRIHYRFLRIFPFETRNGRTARALVNILLQAKGMIGIFRKEDRKAYMETIREANMLIKESEVEYINGLVNNPLECIEIENTFLSKELPFLLVKY